MMSYQTFPLRGLCLALKGVLAGAGIRLGDGKCQGPQDRLVTWLVSLVQLQTVNISSSPDFLFFQKAKTNKAE